jgi:hypothetical protein
MIIVMQEAVSLKRYLDEYSDRSPEWQQGCPVCGWPRLSKHGRFFRFVVFGQLFEHLPIYRRRCSGCGKTFSLLPAFVRPYAHFGVCVHEAAARMLARGEKIDRLAGRLCRSNSAGGVSSRTLLRWLQCWRRRAQALTVSVVERILHLAPGFDVTPYLPASNLPRGWLRSVLALGKILRDLVCGTLSIPLFMFLNGCYPMNMSL